MVERDAQGGGESRSAIAPPAPQRRVRRRALGLFPCLTMGGIVLVFMLGLYLVQPPLLQQTELQTYDVFLRLTADGTPPPGIVIVDIDEKSIAALGQWPWPRYLLAALLEQVDQAGASAVGVDILFSEPDRTSAIQLQAMFARFLGREITFNNLPDELRDNDAILAEALAVTPSVLSMYLRFDPRSPAFGTAARETRRPGLSASGETVPPAPGLVVRESEACAGSGADAPACLEGLLKADSASLPLPSFVNAAPVAFYNAAMDRDGLLRKQPLLLAYKDKVYPCLALRTLMRAENSATLFLETGRDGVETIRLGKYAVPVNSDGTMPVLFRGPGFTYPYVSAVDALLGGADSALFKDAVVFVGSSAVGLRDNRATPFDRHMAGVEMHAATADAIISGRFLSVPPWTPGVQCLGILITGLVCALAFGRARALVHVPLAVGLMGGISWGAARLFLAGMFISPVYMVLTVAGEGFAVLALRFWQEERQKRHLRRAFSRYVAPEIVDRIAGHERDVLAGEERIITVLFSDIRGFTAVSETLSPPRIVRFLNSYFTPMTALVRSRQGTLDKFVGDALMAFWNAPLDVPDHAALALETAMRMREILPDLNNTLQAQCGTRIDIGIGLHTGRAYVGNMGSEELLDYTALGDAVNLSSRLEGLCPVYNVGIVLSADTVRLCSGGRFIFQPLDVVRVKGKKESVEVYVPLRPEEAALRKTELAAYAEARARYTAGNFPAAARAFAELNTHFPTGLYAMYAARCRTLAASPPPDWNGVWLMAGK